MIETTTNGLNGPTYYVRHPDDSYSVADPQPVHHDVAAKNYKLLAQQEARDAGLLYENVKVWRKALLECRAERDAALADAKRYRRLRLLGAAPCETEELLRGTVLRFQSLDMFVDEDLNSHKSRGEQ